MTVNIIVYEPGGQSACVVARHDTDLLDQLDAVCPFEIPYLCSVGACGTCAVRVLSGGHHLDPEGFAIGCSDAPAAGRVLLCVAGTRRSAVEDRDQHQVVLELNSALS